MPSGCMTILPTAITSEARAVSDPDDGGRVVIVNDLDGGDDLAAPPGQFDGRIKRSRARRSLDRRDVDAMGFFDGAKHRLEEAAGKVEELVGDARGDFAMAANGHAHAEHGEALAERDAELEQQRKQEEEQREELRKARHDRPNADGERMTGAGS